MSAFKSALAHVTLSFSTSTCLRSYTHTHTHTHTQCYYLITKFYCALEVLNVILHMEALVPGIKSDATSSNLNANNY